MVTRAVVTRRVYARGTRGSKRVGRGNSHADAARAITDSREEDAEGPLEREDGEMLGDVKVVNGRRRCGRCKMWYPETWEGCRRCKGDRQ